MQRRMLLAALGLWVMAGAIGLPQTQATHAVALQTGRRV